MQRLTGYPSEPGLIRVLNRPTLPRLFNFSPPPFNDRLTVVRPDSPADKPDRPTAWLAEASVDLARQDRCGFPEAIYGQGKTPEQVVAIATALFEAGQAVLVTRVTDEQITAMRLVFPDVIVHPVGRTMRLPAQTPHQMDRAPNTTDRIDRTNVFIPPVAVLTAGTTDGPVAAEAAETLAWMGVPVRQITDVGVAGPDRLRARLSELDGVAAVVVVAGMEGALPSVVGGYVPCPVVAVPTSVGYGAAFGGIAALLGMLNSCAAGVTVVNIDAGFKGGYIAGLIATTAQRTSPKGST